MYFTHWINLHSEQPQDQVSRITETHARWIFVLLSRVDDHVSADEMSLLRSLARACMALLKQSLLLSKRPAEQESYSEPSLMDKTDMSESSCWIVITAIIGIWGQRDLWSDAEQILADVEN